MTRGLQPITGVEPDAAKPRRAKGESKAFADWLGEACDECGMPAALHGAECDEVG